MKPTKEKLHQYYLNNRDYFLAYSVKYRKENRIRLSEYRKQLDRNVKIEVLTHYSNSDLPICGRCGIKDVDVLCIDHINGGGNKQNPVVRSHLYRWLRNNSYPKGFQVLCANCNLKKRILEKQ